MSNYTPSKDEFIRRKKFGKILASEREKKGWTQSYLSELLGYGVQTISNWETGMYFPKKVEDLIRLADILECDVDYILDRIKERTHDIKTACTITGLSESAITKIIEFNQMSEIENTLSHLIVQDGFLVLLQYYKIFLLMIERLNHTEDESTEILIDPKSNLVSLPLSDSIDFFKQRTAEQMTFICRNEPIIPIATYDTEKGWTYPRHESIQNSKEGEKQKESTE